MSNKAYDILKYVAIIALPALTTFWLAISKIWGIPYGTEIGATLTAVTALLGALLCISTYSYNKSLIPVKAEENIEPPTGGEENE